jgi:hypothetical protein
MIETRIPAPGPLPGFVRDVVRYHRISRVEAIMSYGSQGSYLLYVLELHLAPSEL